MQGEFLIFSKYFFSWISGAHGFPSPFFSCLVKKKFETLLVSTKNTGLAHLFEDLEESPVHAIQKKKLTT